MKSTIISAIRFALICVVAWICWKAFFAIVNPQRRPVVIHPLAESVPGFDPSTARPVDPPSK